MKFEKLDEGMLAAKWGGIGDIRCYRPPEGFTAVADLIETNPVTGKLMGQSEWWIFLTLTSGWEN